MDGIKKILKSKQAYEKIFVITILLSFVVWLILLFSEGNVSEQYDIFFRRCADFLADTLNVVGYSSQRDVYNNMMYTGLGEKAYPPLTYVACYFFSRLVNMQPYYDSNRFLAMFYEPQFLIILILFMIITSILMYEMVRTCKNGTSIMKVFTALAVLCSAPMIYSIERANTIILTVFFCMFFIFFYDHKNKILKELALISLAIAVALKITPAVLGLLLLYKKQWKEVGRAVVYGVLIGVLPFLFFTGGFSNIGRMIHNIQENLNTYLSSEGCTLQASVGSYFTNPSEMLQQIVKILTYLIAILFISASFFFEKKWEKIMVVSMVLVFLPSHSGYYCILYLIPAMIAFLNEKEHVYSDFIILVSMLLIMYSVQSEVGKTVLNYHTAILAITVVFIVRSVRVLLRKMRKMRRKEVSA